MKKRVEITFCTQSFRVPKHDVERASELVQHYTWKQMKHSNTNDIELSSIILIMKQLMHFVKK